VAVQTALASRKELTLVGKDDILKELRWIIELLEEKREMLKGLLVIEVDESPEHEDKVIRVYTFKTSVGNQYILHYEVDKIKGRLIVFLYNDEFDD
jgi:hypothetical protein